MSTMIFSVGDITTSWQQAEVGVVTGCTISGHTILSDYEHTDEISRKNE